MRIFFILCLSVMALVSCAQKNAGKSTIPLPEKTTL